MILTTGINREKSVCFVAAGYLQFQALRLFNLICFVVDLRSSSERSQEMRPLLFVKPVSLAG